MTVAQLEKRVTALEKAVAELRAQASPTPNNSSPSEQRHWWRDDAGAFANDPGFEEMVRLGREYRESLRPGQRKKKKQKKNARS